MLLVNCKEPGTDLQEFVNQNKTEPTITEINLGLTKNNMKLPENLIIAFEHDEINRFGNMNCEYGLSIGTTLYELHGIIEAIGGDLNKNGYGYYKRLSDNSWIYFDNTLNDNNGVISTTNKDILACGG